MPVKASMTRLIEYGDDLFLFLFVLCVFQCAEASCCHRLTAQCLTGGWGLENSICDPLTVDVYIPNVKAKFWGDIEKNNTKNNSKKRPAHIRHL